VLTDFSFDTYFNFFSPQTQIDSPFDGCEGSPFVYSPFSQDKCLGSNTKKTEDEFESNQPYRVQSQQQQPSQQSQQTQTSYNSPRPSLPTPTLGVQTQQNMGSPRLNTVQSSPNLGTPQNNTQTTQTTNTTQQTQTGQNLSPPPQGKDKGKDKGKIKKKSTIFTKKKKKTKSYNNSTGFEQVSSNQDLYDDFAKFLTKKKLNENNLKFYCAIKKFEQESGDVHSRAMNLCFEYLGIGGGELSVSVDQSVVSELAQVIRNKQSSKEMFNRAKQAVEAKLRQSFTTFIS